MDVVGDLRSQLKRTLQENEEMRVMINEVVETKAARRGSVTGRRGSLIITETVHGKDETALTVAVPLW